MVIIKIDVRSIYIMGSELNFNGIAGVTRKGGKRGPPSPQFEHAQRSLAVAHLTQKVEDRLIYEILPPLGLLVIFRIASIEPCQVLFQADQTRIPGFGFCKNGALHLGTLLYRCAIRPHEPKRSY